MKIIELPSGSDVVIEAYLQENKAFIYKDNSCEEVLTIEGIELSSNPEPLIVREIELLCKPSLYQSVEMFN